MKCAKKKQNLIYLFETHNNFASAADRGTSTSVTNGNLLSWELTPNIACPQYFRMRPRTADGGPRDLFAIP